MNSLILRNDCFQLLNWPLNHLSPVKEYLCVTINSNPQFCQKDHYHSGVNIPKSNLENFTQYHYFRKAGKSRDQIADSPIPNHYYNALEPKVRLLMVSAEMLYDTNQDLN
ncbi:hypothetical protein RF11_08127 [Thelohanellus kitauei]|uniref:Uncharacterized protein n=1 Tax=Thelohanellus kitauei TaxID=669202 RepID=A0A0C2MQ23_THEKT|nr:hypothetical protein RF11_08127 [Thelohanellus kitauei]